MSQPTTGNLDSTLGIVSFDFGSTASTATAFTQLRGATGPMDPEHVRTVRSLIVDLIRSVWPDEVLHRAFVTQARGQFPDLVGDEIVRGTNPGESETDQLVRWIEEESPGDHASQDLTEPPRTRVLDVVWVSLADFIGLHQPLQEWGNLKLHEILHQALLKPAFVQNNLVRVPLEGQRTTQVDSVLVVRNGNITDAELTSVVPQPGSGDLSFRGLKRRVLKPVPLPPDLRPPTTAHGRTDSDVLVGQAYRFLARKVVDFAAAGLNAPGHRLSNVIVTYPTTTPPAVRHRLRALVSEQLEEADHVTMRFDEGVAALMFVLMRDFGGDNEVGIETFRARSRMANDGHWRQNLLVVDIGGGTTDIALTRLDLRDATPAVDREAELWQESGPDGATNEDPRIRGRVYFLQPEVLGSTGHQQYGGDLLTLRVFYWIKACIADAVRDKAVRRRDGEELLDRWPVTPGKDPVPLARAVVDYPEPGPGPGDVVDYLREVLPTRSPNRPQDAHGYSPQMEPAFIQLWQIALKAKESLAARQPYDLVGTELTNIAAALDGAWADHIGALAAGVQPLQLTVEDFDRLARSVLSPAIALAVDLAWRRLGDEPGELLDGIALTGRAAGIPLVRELMLERLTEVFGARNRGGKPMAWNPALVTTEHDHPKEAASIGACWAQAKYEDTGKSLAAFAESLQYKTGRDQLVINVSNMVVNLPCRFGLGTSHGASLDLLNHGHRLDLCDWTGRRFARTEWLPAHPDIRLLRFLDQQRYIRWGHYNIENRAGFAIPPDLRFQIEIDDELVPTLHMCLGRVPRFGLDGSVINLAGRLPAPCRAADGTVKSLPWDICVLAVDEATGGESWFPVLKAIPTVTSTSFRYEFAPVGAVQAGPSQAPVLATISRELPPPRPPHHSAATAGHATQSAAPGQPEYVFGGIAPGETEPQWRESIAATQLQGPGGREARPAKDRPDVPHWAVLDMFGRLYLPDPGYPRYQRAEDLRMMLGMPGSVFSTPMEPPQPDLRPEWDPFTGEH